jgi:DNA mismatch endonuclease (patch repair protein)
MAAIRSRNTKPEMFVRRAVHAAGFRYGLHCRDLPGKPDLVLRKYGAVVFVHGCFWHGHACADGRLPLTNRRYWLPKIANNIARDRRHIAELRQRGWKVLVARECTLNRDSKRIVSTLNSVRGRAETAANCR